MLRVACPATYAPERLYTLHVLLGEFLGLPFQMVAEERHNVRITLQDDPFGKELLLADTLFQTQERHWLTEQMLPQRPLAKWDVSVLTTCVPLVVEQLPVIYGEPLADGRWILETESGIEIGADLVGSSFFMLTRLEEIICPVRDVHARFPAAASLAAAEGFLQRPIVNEYLEVLWWALHRLWPRLERKKRHFQIRLTHDVDWPLSSLRRTWRQVLKSSAGDVMKRKSVALMTRRLRSYWQGRQGHYEGDIYDTFDHIMDVSEQQGLRSAFYMITGHTAGEIDGVYSISDPWIRKLMRRIHERGHEIGLHPSYETFCNPAQIKREFADLLQAMEEEGIQQDEIGGRQHYLRWENGTTWRGYEEAGLAYDSTLSYADHIGFRCGTCYEYPVFDVRARQMLQLRERPLLIMEQTLLSDAYMNLTRQEALQEVNLLKQSCRQFHGDFTLLWHNDMLLRKQDLTLYQNMVRGNADADTLL